MEQKSLFSDGKAKGIKITVHRQECIIYLNSAFNKEAWQLNIFLINI